MVFERYKPIYLLWLGVIPLVLHIVLHICSLSPLLIMQLSNITVVLVDIVLFCCIALIISNKPTRAQWFFVLILSVNAILATIRVFGALFGSTFVVVETIDSPLIMLIDGFVSLLFMLYPIEILRPYFVNFRNTLKITLPLLIIILQVVVSNYLKSDGQEFLAKLIFISSILMVVGYPLYILMYLLQYQKFHKQWCEQNYSKLEELKTSWVKYYIIGYLFTNVSYVYCMMTVSQEASLVHYVLLLLFFLFVFPLVLSQKELVGYLLEDQMRPITVHYNMDEQSVEERLIYNKSSLIYKEKLLDWMEQDKPYLQADFRLIDIMSVLPLNRSYISRLINEEIGETFFSFVMKYRIEESVRLLDERDDLTIAQVAKESGFSSSSVFGRSFLKNKGMTPLEYRKKAMFDNL